jgi:GTP-binding protein
MIPFAKTHFTKSVMALSGLPRDEGFEIAFAGRSNAGKSTALNTITGIKNLAKTSRTPGRTQTINLFDIDHKWRLVDLPGYGYAKVPLSIKQKWEKVLNDYLTRRECLQGLCLIIDIRHPMQSLDEHMINWAITSQLSTHIILTKADKISRGKALQTAQALQKKIGQPELISCQIFSALNGEGILEARKKISQWFMGH